jgi:hypothetical protein
LANGGTIGDPELSGFVQMKKAIRDVHQTDIKLTFN